MSRPGGFSERLLGDGCLLLSRVLHEKEKDVHVLQRGASEPFQSVGDAVER